MPGIHTLRRNSQESLLTESDFSFALLRENFRVKILDQNGKYCTAVSFHDGFPFQVWDDPEVNIAFEGMIYNRTDEEIRDNLKEIAENFMQEKNCKDLVKHFVESCDGDYTVQILQKTTGNLLIFNDYLGRFSLFYYASPGSFICSPELKTLLHFMPEIRLDRSALAEFLMFQFPLGNKTIFQEIFQLRPSQMIVVRTISGNLSVEVSASADFDFILSNPFQNKKESIDCLNDLFTTCVRDRVHTLEKHGYRIFADLSGGYDSRTVMGALGKQTNDVDYFTFEYTQDESPWAKGIFEKLGSPGVYHKCSFNNVLDESRIGSLVYITDGLVNYRTTSICYQDLEYIKKTWPERAAEVHGGAGEFIRHPFQIFHRSLFDGCTAGLYSGMSLDLACAIVRKDPEEYKNELKSYFASYPEKKPEEQLKRLYYDYFNKLGCGVDNRERILYWALNPFWSMPFLRTVFSRVPLNWAGFHYFVAFMKAVDPRLVDAPLFNKGVNLQSGMSVKLFDIRYRYGNLLQALLKTRLPFLLSVYNPWVRKEDPDNKKILLKEYRDYYAKARLSSAIFDSSVIESELFTNAGDLNCVITLLIYFKEIEDRFKGKIKT